MSTCAEQDRTFSRTSHASRDVRCTAPAFRSDLDVTRRHTPPPAPAAQERIHVLWDELAAFEAAESELALMHLLRTVAGLVDAQNAYWLGAVRLDSDADDPMNGWRPRLIRYLEPLSPDESFTKQRIRSAGRELDESTVAHARQAGTFRANRLRDIVSPEWFAGERYRGYVSQGVHDSLSVIAPVSAAAEAYYGFLRMRPDDPFSDAQRDIAYYALRGLAWFHRQTMLAHGLLVAQSPLTPAERRVLTSLLTDRSEKLIAAELGLSHSTLHTYVRDVFRKFGVSGRAGLVAVWLGRQTPAVSHDTAAVNPPH
jgi:DNA-binding CsgD family transcriptional regulator